MSLLKAHPHNPAAARMPPLSARLPTVMGAPVDIAAPLRGVNFGFFGCGSINGNTLNAICRSTEPASVLCVDNKHTKAESPATHNILPGGPESPKALLEAKRAAALCPHAKIQYVVGDLASLTPADCYGLDLIFLAGDNFRVAAVAAQLSLDLDAPMIYTALHAPSLTIHSRVFVPHGGTGPCPACLLDHRAWQQTADEITFSCGGSASHHARPTHSFAALCALAGDIAALQGLRWLAKLGEPVDNTAVDYCALSHRSVISPLRRKASCRCDHRPCRLIPSSAAALTALTPRALASLAGLADLPALDVAVVGHELLSVTCPACRRHVLRFLPAQTPRPACPACRAPLPPRPRRTYRSIPGNILAPVDAQPLSSLGLSAPRTITLSTNAQRVMFLAIPTEEAST